MVKTIFARFTLAIIAAGLFVTPSCHLGIGKSENKSDQDEYRSVSGKSEYTGITKAGLVAYVQVKYNESQIATLAQAPQRRKKIIDQAKKTFAVAQAAQVDGLDKSEDFYKHLALNTAKLLAQEYTQRDENFKVSKADIDSYLGKHLKEFEADLAFTLKDGGRPQTTQTAESQKAQWAEMQLRAEKGRQAGIEKEAAFQQIVHFLRADILANIYLKKIEEQYRTTEADFKTYYAQHPENDPEKIKQRMSDLMARLKKGEGFEKTADEINEDSTKGKGGDLGWFGEGVMAAELEKAAFALQPGQICQEPIKTEYGYHLIKVDGRRKGEVHAKHIFLSTKAGEEAVSRQTKGKIERAIEVIRLKYMVNAPEDFEIKVEGLSQAQSPPASNRDKVGR